MREITLIAVALLSGVAGTGLGGALAALLPGIGRRVMARILFFTGGLMIAIVCFELLPEALLLSSRTAAAFLLLGMAVMLGGDVLLSRGKGMASSPLRTGLLVGAGIALHNLPEGLAVGAGYADAPVFGLTLCAAIALHDVPEGLAMALPLKTGGMRAGRMVALTVLAGLPTMLGAVLGLLVGGLSPAALAACLALAGGAMLQITCMSLLPEAARGGMGRPETLCLSCGVVAGCFLTIWL